MSWNVSFAAGSPEAISAELDKNEYIPAGVKQTIVNATKDMTLKPEEVALVKTEGHVEPRYGGRGTFEVMIVKRL